MHTQKRNTQLFFVLLFALAALFLVGCGATEQETTNANETQTLKADNMSGDVGAGANDANSIETMDDNVDMNHMGCQEGEISANGECIPAADNNRALFDQNLTGVVEAYVVDSPIGGYFAKPATDGNYPGVILIHEWWGLNDNIKDMADILAAEGYLVYAVDLYGGEVASESSDAARLSGSVRSNPGGAIEVMSAAKTYLEEEGATKLGSMGWCFGGQQSLLISTSDPLDATVIYYGQLTDNTTILSNLGGPVLGVFGEDDGFISVESVQNFESALESIGVESDIYVYKGVGHAFANPSGSNYAPEQTLDAWSRTLEFLNKNLK